MGLFRAGWVPIACRGPNWAISREPVDNVINCNDLGSVAGYVNPNEIIESSLGEQDDPPDAAARASCKDMVQAQCGDTVDNRIESDKELNAGLLSASANGVKFTIGSTSKTFIFPSLSPLRVVETCVNDYDLVLFEDGGEVGAGKGGKPDLSARGNTLSHTCSCIALDKDGTGEGLGGVGGGSIGYSKYMATDFCCPIDGTLESFSANIGDGNVAFSYSYRDLPAIPPKVFYKSTNSNSKKTNATI